MPPEPPFAKPAKSSPPAESRVHPLAKPRPSPPAQRHGVAHPPSWRRRASDAAQAGQGPCAFAVDRCLERRMKHTRIFRRAGEALRLGEEPDGHSIFANEVDELALNADPVGAENARLIGRIGGF
jgi:hypothetical protein